MMECVTSPSFFILINGKSYGNLQPSRGIHQGDPLSPYLFLLCTEGFIAQMEKAVQERQIQGVSICRRAPKLTNLLFADDSLLFCQATHSKVTVIMEILQLYAGASGQSINLEKSSVYFSGNTPMEQNHRIVSTLGVKEVVRFDSYLGVGNTKIFPFLQIGFGKNCKGGRECCYLR